MPTAILAYVPVLHQGYLNFFKKNAQAHELYLVNEELTLQVEALEKDIRALPATEMKKAIEALGLFEKIMVVGKKELEEVATSLQERTWIIPDEEFMHVLTEAYFAHNASDQKIIFDSTFLRWDRKKILAENEVESAKPILPKTFNQKFLSEASELKKKSSDWWRHVAGVIVKDGEILLSAWNKHLPTELEPYFNGDPRATFHKGEHIDLSTAIHAESGLIAQAAKKGISVEGTEMYLTTFPCPVCAKLVASAGIKRVYFSEGYAMLDGESILKSAGVEIYKVDEKAK